MPTGTPAQPLYPRTVVAMMSGADGPPTTFVDAADSRGLDVVPAVFDGTTAQDGIGIAQTGLPMT